MNFQEWWLKQGEEAMPNDEWESIDEAAQASWNAALDAVAHELDALYRSGQPLTVGMLLFKLKLQELK
jgi:hypothetical protein